MSYSRIANHGAMLFDSRRNEAYARAVRQLVKPDSVVLDLGAGMGLHGLLAAAAGAARVYLVDPQPVVHAAAEAARKAGLSERIVIVQERIEETQLPQDVDLIVSVLTGNLLFSEDLLPSLFVARDRYLKPGGALVPDRAQLCLAPLSAAELHREHVGRWSDPVMDFDYAAARPFVANEILWPRREQFRGTRQLGSGGAVVDLDLATAVDPDCRGDVCGRVHTTGLCHGLLAWIRIRLFDSWVSTGIDAPEMHWSPALLPIDPPLPLTAGDELTMSLLRPAFGDWTWSLTAPAGTRRHSSFLAKSDGFRELARVAPAARPELSRRGERTLRVMTLLHQQLSIQQIVDHLVTNEGAQKADALREVQAIALKFGREK
jgi:SAM-dependent methyltransferase